MKLALRSLTNEGILHVNLHYTRTVPSKLVALMRMMSNEQHCNESETAAAAADRITFCLPQVNL
jgi:hypothetical protein